MASLAGRLERSADGVRFTRALLAAIAGVILALSGAVADATLHRGVESGAEDPIVRHATGRDLAANIDLTRFAPEQVPQVAAALQANGIRYVRQSFAWAALEPAPGEFAWERYDTIVDELSRRGIVVVAVLHRSPAWAREQAQAGAFDAPPIDSAAWERFVTAVVGHYGGAVPFVQLWDQPNLPDHWAGAAPDPAAYTGLLALGSNAARTANPNVAVVLAEFAPSVDGGAIGADLRFLNGVYAAGGRPFFDIIAARVAGGDQTPYDRRVDAETLGMSRAILFREAALAAGDAAKPIWATHFGWRAVAPDESGPDAATVAAYAVAGVERSRAEWPWMGPLFAWGLAPGPDLGGMVEPGEALLGADGLPTALLTALGGFAAAANTAAAPTGFLPVDARQFTYEGNWDKQHLGTATYRTTAEVGARFRVRFEGTGAVARLRFSRQAGQVSASLDDRPLPLKLDAFQATDADIPVAASLAEGEHTFALELISPGQFTIGGLIVERAIPLRWPIVLLVGAGVGLLAWGIRLLFFTLAERSGRLQRRRGVELWPELPHLPTWRPSRRA